jgi:hypothetical protein
MTESAPTDDSGAEHPSEGASAKSDDAGGPAPAAEPSKPEPGTWVANNPEGFGEGANPPPNRTRDTQPPAPGAWTDAPAGLPPGPPGAGGVLPAGLPGQYPQPGYPAYQPAPYPGGYPPSGQASPGYPVQHPGRARPTNAMAIISLVLGILGLVLFFGVASIPAVILGHIARKQIRERDEDGDGIAMAGLILGWIGVGLVLLVIGFVVVVFGVVAVGSANR